MNEKRIAEVEQLTENDIFHCENDSSADLKLFVSELRGWSKAWKGLARKYLLLYELAARDWRSMVRSIGDEKHRTERAEAKVERLQAWQRQAAETAYQEQVVDTEMEEITVGADMEYASKQDWIEQYIENSYPYPESGESLRRQKSEQ